ncbi:hypothetical protein C8R42DRAFT_645926 [Lentinula raphanica]|nr:hypothetical protein C8R42DRAFT_645926 [Lentinula raphanica]
MPREATIKSYHSSPQPHPSMFGRPHRLKPKPVGWRQSVEDDFDPSAASSPTLSSRNRVRGSPIIGYPALGTKAAPTSTPLHRRLTKLSNQSRSELLRSPEFVNDNQTGTPTSSPPPSSPTPSLRNRSALLRPRLMKPSTAPTMRSLTHAHPLAGWEPPSDPAMCDLTSEDHLILLNVMARIGRPKVDTHAIASEYEVQTMACSDYPKLIKIRKELLALSKTVNPFATQRLVERVELQMEALARIADRPMNHPKYRALPHPDYVPWIPPTDASKNWVQLEKFLLRHDPEGFHGIHQQFVIRLKEISDWSSWSVKIDRFDHLFGEEELSESDLIYTLPNEIFGQACHHFINCHYGINVAKKSE